MNLKKKMLEGREEVTAKNLREIGKKENRIERSAEKLVGMLMEKIILMASRGKTKASVDAIRYKMGSATGKTKRIELIDTGAGENALVGKGGSFREEVFKKALSKVRDRYGKNGIEFGVEDREELSDNRFRFWASW